MWGSPGSECSERERTDSQVGAEDCQAHSIEVPSPARPNPVRKRIKTRGATLHSFVLNTSLGGLSKEALGFFTVLPAMYHVYLDVSIQAHHRLHQTLFDGGAGVLGSDICPGYERRLITLGKIAGLGSGRDQRETAAGEVTMEKITVVCH